MLLLIFSGSYGPGAPVVPNVCGTIIGADLAYASVVGTIASYSIEGDDEARASITGDDQECQ